MANYFNTLPLRAQLAELGKCRFMHLDEFSDGVEALRGKKMVVIGCGAQGLNQGLNLRDSGLDVSYALRDEAIAQQRQSWKNATENGFTVGTYEELLPTADVVLNLTPDKQHTNVVETIMPMMKRGACLSYSHGFNIVEEGMQVRDDITVIMVAPKCPGSEVRAEYVRGFGVPTLIAVHEDNDPDGEGLALAKAYAVGTGGHKAGVLMSSFIAEVKSDLMGEQTILCGMLQTGSLLCFDKMVDEGIDPAGMHCVVFGAGGAARAVVRALASAGADRVTVVNRSEDRAQVAAALAGDRGAVATAAAVTDADLVVNATPVGMGDDGGLVIDPETAKPGAVVADLVYHPAVTPLLAAATSAGHPIVGGLGMLVHQAARAFERWTGVDAPIDEMASAARDALR